MNIAGPFIRRPIATTLLAIGVLLAGAWAYTLLPVSPLPRVDFPTISVSASLPGASPETMASSVATPLERRFGRIAGVNEITSTNVLGTTNITLQFDLDRDVDSAARDVQAAIAAAGGELPTNLPFRPTYRKVNPSDSPVLILAMTSDTIPLSQVFESANSILAQKIAQVPGVGQVFVGGGQQPAVRIQADPKALAGVGLSMEDLRNSVASATALEAKGSISNSQQAQVIGANDQLFGADAFRNLVIAYRNGAPVRLNEVSKVFDDVENNRVAAWFNGKRAVLVIIRRQPGSNIIDVTGRVTKLVPQLVSSISPAIKTEVAVERTKSIRGSVADVERTLVLSVLLVVGVVFVFLRSFRATLIPSVAVPLSLVGTFGAMYLLGYSLDILSLMALTISTGFVVDDAIVVTENITRFIEHGKKPIEAALEGAKQIGFTIVSITCSLLAVFIPLLMMGGIVGRLFREFAVTLSIAIGFSALVSLTLTPMMCSRLLRPTGHDHGKLYNASERAFEAILRGYERSLDWVLNHRLFVQAIMLGTIGLTVFLFIISPKGLFPQQDVGLLAGFSEAPQDVSFKTMYQKQLTVNQIVQADPDVANVVSFIGSGNGSTGNTGTVFVDLKPIPPRKTSADRIIGRLRPQLGRLVGVSLFLQAVQDIRVGGRSSRTQYQYTLEDADLDELRDWAPKVMDRFKKISILKDVATDQQTSGLTLQLGIDRDTSARLGITPAAIDNALYDAYGQRQIATMYGPLNQYRVVIETKPEFQVGPESLNELYVGGPTGAQVPMPAITHSSITFTPLAINHQGQFPAITLSFNLGPGSSLGDAMKAIDLAERDIGMPPSIHAAFAGTAQAFSSSLSSQPTLLMIALLTVYIVLGVLYESYVHPITILSTIPSAGVGALLALLLYKTEFNVIAMVGLILLIGIVKKNAIMMIDFAIEARRDRNLSAHDAIREACILRFRPILMTTMAALLGALPLAFGTGIGSEMRKPLGISIVGGLILSQLLTLYTTPVTYLSLDRFTRKKRYQTHAPALESAEAHAE
ncbi:MAG TPA: efflux RND transporter permease subunit [Polyangiaceae bacterium]|jgi:hydrophobe/amphiphile efflux-1 (HAE1) family protein|nr:efflux RND transporter permease subunit [Polyangiaceae bacterium]